jgi:hypothetical protein
LTNLYDDPHFQPPADISGAEARAYEEKIVSMLRDELLPSSGPWGTLRSIDLRGERPDTEIIFRYTKPDRPYSIAVGTALWRQGWPFEENEEFVDTLHDAASVGGWIYSAWLAGDLEPIDNG